MISNRDYSKLSFYNEAMLAMRVCQSKLQSKLNCVKCSSALITIGETIDFLSLVRFKDRRINLSSHLRFSEKMC